RRPRHDRNRYRRQQPRQDGVQPAADGEAGEGTQKRERHGRGWRERQKDARRSAAGEGAPAGGERSPGREPREGKGRPSRERFQGKGRDRDQDKDRFQNSRKGRSDAGPSHRPYASSAPRERERSIDPNSPFAKLAALREQLAGRKD